MPHGVFGSVVGVPLTSGGRVVGVLGLASGRPGRRWDRARHRRADELRQAGVDRASTTRGSWTSRSVAPCTTRRPACPTASSSPTGSAHALAGHRDDDTESIAVVLLDLDRFKVINESLGHAVGDRLLVAVGQRLVNGLRPGDTVARVGGDEFGIILDPVADADEARQIAERIVRELRAPFPLNGRDWFISASMGIALAQPGRATPDELLREAEIAMVRAKGDATQRHALFEPSMSAQTLERIELESDLRRRAGARRASGALPADRRPSRAARSSGSRRWCAGSTRRAASSRPSPSSRSPRRPG